MYLLMTLLSRGRMSDYADSSSGYGAELFAVILVIGFVLGNYTLFTLIFKKFTFMIITFKLFVIFAPNIQIRLDFSNHCTTYK